jgi:hypothetical protein
MVPANLKQDIKICLAGSYLFLAGKILFMPNIYERRPGEEHASPPAL